MGKILIALDGSLESEAAVTEAARLAEGTEDAIALLTVGSEPPGPHRDDLGDQTELARPAPTFSPPGMAVRVAEQDEGRRNEEFERAEREMNNYLRDVVRKSFSERRNVETVVRFGDPAESILDYSRANDVDIIVMSTHGRSGLSRLTQGSVAAEVMRKAERPVLLVGPKYRHRAG